MMRKGERTRRAIIEKTAVLFNEQGYAATSMADVTAATGIQRGGIYNHFTDKEALARASFAYATQHMVQRMREALREVADPVDRLLAFPEVFAHMYAEDPPFPNGCVLLNTAVEAKGQWAVLREDVRTAADKLLEVVAEAVRKGQQRRQLRSSVNPEEVASIMLSTLEGGMLFTTLYGASVHLERVARHLRGYVEDLRVS